MDRYEQAFVDFEKGIEMVNGRVKGANFEREICRMLAEELSTEACPVEPKRDLEQYRAADRGDIIGIDGWTIECKRYASSSGGNYKGSWLRQLFTASDARGTEGALIYKYDRQPIKCVVRLSSINADFAGKDNVAEVSFSTLCMLIRESWCE